ncbi:hypothetical protein MKW98_002943 [Papaver atlanticum]|uniref:Uncharacterized protein n=1 Tax=Papaver atlanticum TaxID=357466 RepID=A0AAD4XMP4_9MAGN|nr:hypothetical protein MKW98_002943 [Papaver atlanticum]
MESISTRFQRTIFLVMFLLIGFGLLTTTVTPDDNELYIKMNTGISRKLIGLRYKPVKPASPISNPPERRGPPRPR